MGVKRANKNIRKEKMLFMTTGILIAIIIILIALFLYLNSQNYINYGPINSTRERPNVDAATLSQSGAVILNNVLLGGVNSTGWVSAENMMDTLKDSIEINMYSPDGLLGTYETAKFKEADTYYYTKTTKYPQPEEYLGIQKNASIAFSRMEKIDADDSDIKNIKDALGKYRLLNNSVKINEAYQIRLLDGELGKIYSVTSNGKNIFGVYSAIVYSYAGNNTLIKYSYVKDTEYSTAWPVYSIKYAVDLNADGRNELIIQETTANSIRYVVDEIAERYSFREVLKVDVNIGK